jgi:hypothetical protein
VRLRHVPVGAAPRKGREHHPVRELERPTGWLLVASSWKKPAAELVLLCSVSCFGVCY